MSHACPMVSLKDCTAIAGEPSNFTCPELSSHLDTVAWVVEQFLPGRVQLDIGPPARVRVTPAGDSR